MTRRLAALLVAVAAVVAAFAVPAASTPPASVSAGCWFFQDCWKGKKAADTEQAPTAGIKRCWVFYCPDQTNPANVVVDKPVTYGKRSCIIPTAPGCPGSTHDDQRQTQPRENSRNRGPVANGDRACVVPGWGCR